ncbi:tetratricopeptide repeat protein [Roseiconus lacunae]|uniref:Tetratricopeptide repeat protein n=1 Tax=Roseiconus lacunae TaxID=2605694 RepID=A0ABT7PMG8_9BACT|nr:tetratricopeptide repeat protein [Roseiconus lacunae]MCD0463410.1 tetratricopeptide repeat protein [Roseiconus lacunae]MDM4017712.1 tetratricopeptide repeat protein [Roseiconus lacunae]WRQ48533.1 tetratricopeptide repeat protein [Stieleria sp. HD01]
MPVLLEGTAVVIRNDALDRCLDGGAADFHTIAPNSMSFGDGELSQASFMSPRDAEIFFEKLVLMGLRGEGDSPEVVLVDAHHQSVTPECEWLQLMEYKGNLIASLVGNDSNVVVAPESWDPEQGPTLQHMSADEVRDRLEFVRREDKVDVYRDRETGELLYSARINDTPEEMYQVAAKAVLENMRMPGGPPLKRPAQKQVREAIGALQQLLSRHEESWRIWFLLGKAWHSVQRLSRSVQAYEHADEVSDEPQTVILKEWAGVLLEMGKTGDAVEIGERAVAVRPNDVELLGNLAVAYLLDERVQSAVKTIRHAIAIQPDDQTNKFLAKRIDAVSTGESRIPRSIAELEGRSRLGDPARFRNQGNVDERRGSKSSWLKRWVDFWLGRQNK